MFEITSCEKLFNINIKRFYLKQNILKKYVKFIK